MNRAQRSALRDGLCFAALTILVWGVTALQRGPWQDDVKALAKAFERSLSGDYVSALFSPDASPLRRLTFLPFAIAHATPQPIWALQVLCGVVWLLVRPLPGGGVGVLVPRGREERTLE